MLEDLVKKDKYQVFVLSCPASIPFSVFRHLWIVINKKGKLERYEVRHFKNQNTNLGYLHINDQSPFSGIYKFLFIKKHFFWKPTLLKQAEGDENSLAFKIIDFVEKSEKNYTYLNTYFPTGPNSNTYVSWILKNFPEFELKLDWFYIGKNYKK